MRSDHAPRLLGLLAGCVAACSHGKAATPAGVEAPAPVTAQPHSTLSAEEIQRVNGRPIEQLIMDRFPGVIASRAADGTLYLRIRGVGSFYSNNEPLYVIDGNPMPDASALRILNPYDVVSIEVVKDPAGMALYGVRGANGVIIIKTKVGDQ